MAPYGTIQQKESWVLMASYGAERVNQHIHFLLYKNLFPFDSLLPLAEAILTTLSNEVGD